MHTHAAFLITLLGALPKGLAVPAPQMGDYGENKGPVGGVAPPIPSVTAPTGNLRGDAGLLGGNAPRPDPDTSDSAIVDDVQLVPGQQADGKLGLYLNFDGVDAPQPIRGKLGSPDPGPRTNAYEKLNPDLYAPPATDKGDVENAMWPLGLSHNRLGSESGAGWARQQNTKVLPVATSMAGVNMKLQPNAYREMHWHTSAEWALMLKGSCRIAAMNEDGKSFVDDLTAGVSPDSSLETVQSMGADQVQDVWFFPKGVPHSIQAFDQGTEFLLVFDNGGFSEENTFLASQMFLRNPLSVLSKNLKVDVSAFDNIPQDQRYIFNGTPPPKDIQEQNQTSSAGSLVGAESYTYHWSQQQPLQVPGGSVKILDSQTFPIASNFAAALVVVQPGAMREIHWHTTSDEWNYFLQGSGRMTIFEAPEASRTFDFTAGDVGYIKVGDSHYIENTGTEDVIFLEVLQAPKFSDISAAQWLALTPKQVVKDTLNLSDEVIAALPREKEYIKPGNPNMTALADGGKSVKRSFKA